MVATQSNDITPERFEFHVSRWLCLLPLLFFIVPMLWMSIIRVGSMSVVLGFTLVGVILTSFFAKNWDEYWGVISRGMLKPSVAMFVLIFTIVGIFAKLVAKSNVAGGVIWLASATGVEGTLFTAFVFVACCILSTGSGSSMATVLTLGPPLYPAGVILGADPFLLTGALVAGANFGDNLAPVSDTTIVSAAGQMYQHKVGPADIGGVVRSRFKYAIIAGVISLILYLFIGSGAKFLTPAEAAALITKYSYAKGLLMLLPVAVIIFFAVRGTHIATALTLGIVTGAIIAFIFGILTVDDFIQLKGKKLVGIIPDGATMMLRQIIVLMLLMGAGELIIATGVMQDMMESLSKMVSKPAGTEVMMCILGAIVGLMGGFAIMGMAIAAPFINAMGHDQKIHPYRRANILDAMTTSMCHAIPWSKQLFVLAGLLTAMKDTYSFVPVITPTQFFYYCFHPWILMILMVIFAFVGWGRIFEGKDGKVIKGYYQNEVPAEARDAALAA
jgi:Na+/H+ antiporter NhaC